VHFKKNDPTTKLLNKLKIDYDLAKEQYLNMTPSEEEFLENLPRALTHNDLGQDDSLKKALLTILQINLTKNQKHLF
jgi:ATP-dependent Clp protease ATP-binding subunit ClpC